MTITVTCRCPLCGKISNVVCEESAWHAYAYGALAQDAFADMDIHLRETIISGMCLPCQESFFEEDDDDCDGECSTCEHYDCPLITNEDS